jgi:predicted acyltransferase
MLPKDVATFHQFSNENKFRRTSLIYHFIAQGCGTIVNIFCLKSVMEALSMINLETSLFSSNAYIRSRQKQQSALSCVIIEGLWRHLHVSPLKYAKK